MKTKLMSILLGIAVVGLVACESPKAPEEHGAAHEAAPVAPAAEAPAAHEAAPAEAPAEAPAAEAPAAPAAEAPAGH